MIDLFLDLDTVGDDVNVRLARSPGGSTTESARVSKTQVEDLIKRAKGLFEGRQGLKLALLGQELFDLVLPGRLGAFWRESYAMATAAESPIRLRVKAMPAVPWELLHDGQRLLANDPYSAVVRFSEEYEPGRSYRVAPPVRVLVTSAGYSADRWEVPVVEAYETWGRLAEKPVVQHRLELGQLDEIFRRARNDGRPFHIWHHSGHGMAEKGTGEFRMQLHSTNGVNEYATVEQFQMLLAANRDLRIASLSVCHAGSLYGLAPALAQLNVPAVIAFPDLIAKEGAGIFMKVLHEGLRVLPIEQAASDARRSLQSLRPDLPFSSMPLLFSRRTDWGPLVANNVAPARKPGLRRLPGRVKVDIGKVGGRDNTVVGAIGSTANQNVHLSVAEVLGEGNSVIGAVEGFSTADVFNRNTRLQEIARRAHE